MEKLTILDKKMLRLSLGRQFRQSLLGRILLLVSIVPGTHALAASSSAPLAVTVAVVRSCNVATASASFFDGKTSTTADSIVTILCPHGFNPAVTVNSRSYASDLASTGTRFSVANTTRSKSSATASDQSAVETHRSGFSNLPARSREPRAITSSEPTWDAEKGSYPDNVKVTVNF